MRKEQRDTTLGLLFGQTKGALDSLRKSGTKVPAEISLYLGVLHGNVAKIMDSIAINHENEIALLKRHHLKELRELESYYTGKYVDDDQQETH